MRNPGYLLFLDLAVAILVVWDLVRALKTGRARGRWGTITRAHQPERFWRYIYQSYALLAFLAATCVWVLVWPDSLR
jgi:hypothetical protein